MADWIHCNTCYGQPGRDRHFSLTNCGHIFCHTCLETSTKEKCKMCNEVCTSTPLSSEIRPEVEMYFTDPIELANRYYKEFLTQPIQHVLDVTSLNNKKLIRVLDFQKGHRKRLIQFHREQLTKLYSSQKQAVTGFKQMEKQLEQIRQESEMNKREMENAKRELEIMKKENTYMRKLLSSPSVMHKDNQRLGHNSNQTREALMSAMPGSRVDLPVSKKSKWPTPNSASQPNQYQNQNETPSSQLSRGMSTFNFLTPNDNQFPPKMSNFVTPTPGPARVSVRTPPSNCKMGIIPHYPQQSGQNRIPLAAITTTPAFSQSRTCGENNERRNQSGQFFTFK